LQCLAAAANRHVVLRANRRALLASSKLVFRAARGLRVRAQTILRAASGGRHSSRCRAVLWLHDDAISRLFAPAFALLDHSEIAYSSRTPRREWSIVNRVDLFEAAHGCTNRVFALQVCIRG
jgi:hypothetical protein